LGLDKDRLTVSQIVRLLRIRVRDTTTKERIEGIAVRTRSTESESGTMTLNSQKQTKPLQTFYWYDFETFGVDPRRDRASQFAGVRTDEQFNIIGDPLVIYCQPAQDFLPGPIACLITGISPQQALAEGLTEAEFIRQIHNEFSEPDTCVVGYNSIRFDDEMTRQLLYRNFYDPYEREWKNGNSRWDVIDMVRLCAATRPEGVNWPLKEDGSVSFRLEELTKANGIDHGRAHDALSDVIATIEIAKLIKTAQPKLFDYALGLRNKKKVQAELDLTSKKPVLHVSMMYPAKLGCLALVMPLCLHPTNSNGVIVYDLREDPSSWLALSAAEIKERVYTSSDNLPEGVSRIPLKTVHINKCPIITSAAVLSDAQAEKYKIDKSQCQTHWQMLMDNPGAWRKVSDVFKEEFAEKEQDPDFMIYSGGFFSDSDKSLMKTIRQTSPKDLARLDMPFRDRRLKEMLFRYRARNYPETLNDQEAQEWETFRLARLSDPAAIARFDAEMSEAMERAADDQTHQALTQLENYSKELLKKTSGD
jgi:exodeoxyribonuclease I